MVFCDVDCLLLGKGASTKRRMLPAPPTILKKQALDKEPAPAETQTQVDDPAQTAENKPAALRQTQVFEPSKAATAADMQTPKQADQKPPQASALEPTPDKGAASAGMRTPEQADQKPPQASPVEPADKRKAAASAGMQTPKEADQKPPQASLVEPADKGKAAASAGMQTPEREASPLEPAADKDKAAAAAGLQTSKEPDQKPPQASPVDTADKDKAAAAAGTQTPTEADQKPPQASPVEPADKRKAAASAGMQTPKEADQKPPQASLVEPADKGKAAASAGMQTPKEAEQKPPQASPVEPAEDKAAAAAGTPTHKQADQKPPQASPAEPTDDKPSQAIVPAIEIATEPTASAAIKIAPTDPAASGENHGTDTLQQELEAAMEQQADVEDITRRLQASDAIANTIRALLRRPATVDLEALTAQLKQAGAIPNIPAPDVATQAAAATAAHQEASKSLHAGNQADNTKPAAAATPHDQASQSDKTQPAAAAAARPEASQSDKTTAAEQRTAPSKPTAKAVAIKKEPVDTTAANESQKEEGEEVAAKEGETEAQRLKREAHNAYMRFYRSLRNLVICRLLVVCVTPVYSCPGIMHILIEATRFAHPKCEPKHLTPMARSATCLHLDISFKAKKILRVGPGEKATRRSCRPCSSASLRLMRTGSAAPS